MFGLVTSANAVTANDIVVFVKALRIASGKAFGHGKSEKPWRVTTANFVLIFCCLFIGDLERGDF